jgi:hypothetical protein
MPRAKHCLFLVPTFLFAIACGGSQKHAEVPDFTEKGWSGPSTAAADPPIQAAPKAENSTPTPPPDAAPVAAESDVVSGKALPSPRKRAAKPGKTKGRAEPRKKKPRTSPSA